ncbi:hypothetical protein Tco_0644979 [Tanacetum coccineum]
MLTLEGFPFVTTRFVHSGFRDWRLELTVTFSISTILGSNTSTKLARAKLDKYSGDAGMSKDVLGPDQPGRTLEKLLGYKEVSSREAKLTQILINAEKAKNMVDSQPMEEEVQGTKMRDAGTKTQKGATGPTFQTQTTPSPSLAFVKENIDVLRTMIKELDHQAKAKATPRKLIYVDSKKEAPGRSTTKGFSDRFSLEYTDMSDTRGETYSTGKGQKGLLKGKEPSHLRRSKRLEN